MDDAFLPRNPSNEEHERLLDSVLRQRRRRIRLPIFFEIDPVIDHVQSFRLDVEKPFDVRFGLPGNSDNGVCHFQCGLLHPH